MAYTHTEIQIIPSPEYTCTLSGAKVYAVQEVQFAGKLPIFQQLVRGSLDLPAAVRLSDDLQRQCDEFDQANSRGIYSPLFALPQGAAR